MKKIPVSYWIFAVLCFLWGCVDVYAQAILEGFVASRDDLNTALAAIGVLEPEKIAPDSVSGEGDSPYRYVATIILSTEV